MNSKRLVPVGRPIDFSFAPVTPCDCSQSLSPIPHVFIHLYSWILLRSGQHLCPLAFSDSECPYMSVCLTHSLALQSLSATLPMSATCFYLCYFVFSPLAPPHGLIPLPPLPKLSHYYFQSVFSSMLDTRTIFASLFPMRIYSK